MSDGSNEVFSGGDIMLEIKIEPAPPRQPTLKYIRHGLITVCCPKATDAHVSCVCMVVITCTDHGETHIGTHD